MVKSFLKKIGLALLVVLLVQAIAMAQDNPTADASFKSRCQNANTLGFPNCANTPSECLSKDMNVGKPGGSLYRTPFNCIFLNEPIGGKTGYDLFKVTTVDTANNGKQSNYQLWYGEAIVGNDTGPFQAVLAFEPGKENQGPFGLLYNYLALVYNWLSGIIIAFVILIAIVGGIQMTTSAGNQEQFSSGKKMIIKALIGMVIWFTASVILYTINPTFFAF
jgi:hypothetical protein